jgi:hypothetical protein
MRLARAARSLPALLLWTLATLAAPAVCEALVDGQLGDVHCLGEGQVGPPACPSGEACQSGLCVPSEIGAPCAADADCTAPELCLDVQALGGTGPARCSRTCCTSADCEPDPGSVCWIPPAGGGSFCRPAAEVGRVAGGTLAALSRCASGADCRSGLCVGQQCADTCCDDTDCASAGGICRLDGPPGVDARGFWCGAAVGALPRYAACVHDGDCASGLCAPLAAGLSLCSSPCCSSSDCESADGVRVRCVMLTGEHAGVRACGTELSIGDAAVGVACAADGDCRGGICLESGGHKECSDLCCLDASCGDPSAVVCRPAMVDSAWALQCAPK